MEISTADVPTWLIAVNASRLKQRTESAEFHTVARLAGYRLLFNKLGRDGSGKANLQRVERGESYVYGVIYSVLNSEVVTILDAKEEGYRRLELEVGVLNGLETCNVKSYLADPESVDNSLRPLDWYQGLVVAGALEHALPVEYTVSIASVPALKDPRYERREAALGLFGHHREEFEAGLFTANALRARFNLPRRG